MLVYHHLHWCRRKSYLVLGNDIRRSYDLIVLYRQHRRWLVERRQLVQL